MTAADAHNSPDRAHPSSASDMPSADAPSAPDDGLLQEVYDELRWLARRHLASERPDHTLQPTALVHEAYLRLAEQNRVPWQNRKQFIALASTAIRRILVDYARAQNTLKRSPHTPQRAELRIEVGPDIHAMWNEDLAALDEALNQLAEVQPRCAQVVELRHFGGLSIEETAETLSVSPATVERDWKFARAWLKAKLISPKPAPPAARSGSRTTRTTQQEHGQRPSGTGGDTAHES